MMHITALLKRLLPYTPYAALALLILGPLLAPGYVLAVDMVFSPHTAWPDNLTSGYPYHVFVHLLNVVLPADLIQKMLLFGIFTIMGAGAHTLVSELRPVPMPYQPWRLACYWAGLFYALNPFVYARFLSGQYLLLLGYALLPWFVWGLWRLLRRPGLRQVWPPVIFAVLIGVFSLHMLGVAGLAGAILVLVISVQRWPDRTWRQKSLRFLSVGLATFIVLSSYWIIPLATGSGEQAATISGFTQADREAFRTVPGSLTILGNPLALYGFWGDDQNLYTLPEDHYSWWWMPIVGLWALVAIGMVRAWRLRATRPMALVFSACLVIGLLWAISSAVSPFATIHEWAAKYLPLIAGYREPHKFVALIALAYVYFGAFGVTVVRQFIGERWQRTVALAGVFLLPLACTPLLLFGGQGQLSAQEYPAGWYAANRYLNQQSGNRTAAVLPWHLYLPLSFSEGVSANPAPAFFEAPVVHSNDPELGASRGYAADNTQTEAVSRAWVAPPAELATRLAAEKIRYIILLKEYDFENYTYISNAPDIALVRDFGDLVLYEVKGAR